MRLAQANLVTKTNLDAKLSSLNKKITSNKTRHLLIKNKLGYFRGKNHFDEDGTQNYYIFQPISKYLKAGYVSDINCILSWQSRGLSNLKIDSIKTNNYLLTPRMNHYDMSKIRMKFDGSLLS